MTNLIFTSIISEQQAPGFCWWCRLIYHPFILYSLSSNHDWITSENETSNFKLVKPRIFLCFFIPANMKELAVCLQKKSRTREMYAKPGIKWIASNSLETCTPAPVTSGSRQDYWHLSFLSPIFTHRLFRKEEKMHIYRGVWISFTLL